MRRKGGGDICQDGIIYFREGSYILGADQIFQRGDHIFLGGIRYFCGGLDILGGDQIFQRGSDIAEGIPYIGGADKSKQALQNGIVGYTLPQNNHLKYVLVFVRYRVTV